MSRASICMVAAATLLAVTAAAAAPVMSDADMRAAVRSYATCLAHKATGHTRTFVLGEGRNPPSIPNCYPSNVAGLQFAGENQRYALAEALLLLDFPHGVPANVVQMPASDHGPRPGSVADRAARAGRDPAYRESLTQADAVWSLGMIADCVARADPLDAFALVRSEDGSAQETAAIGGLRPALAGCLPAGATVRLDRASVRGPVALYLYRLAVQASGGRHD